MVYYKRDESYICIRLNISLDKMTTKSKPRHQSTGEEIANSVSHGVGLLAAIAALTILVIAAASGSDALGIVGASVFGGTMVLLYLISTLYHALPKNKAKRVFQILDHGAIFLLIAGTYTPFALGVLRGTWGWTLLGLVWGFALAGIIFKAARGVKHKILSICLYLSMSLLFIIVVEPLGTGMSQSGLFWMLAGGVIYIIGVFFFLAERIRYSHLVWHLLVMGGNACHFIAALWYVDG